MVKISTLIMDTLEQCIKTEIEAFKKSFEDILTSNVPLADSVIRYFLDRRGKQVRPLVTILAAKLLGENVPQSTIDGAVAIELLHNATLMHDDVIDQSDERRGMPSINKIWDNKVAVLMGDFFLSKSLASSNATGLLSVSNILAEIVTRLAEGELEQLANMRGRVLDEKAYFSVISGKTASLFVACMKVGALTVNASSDEIDRIAQVGEKMGLIFQIRDDIFDYYPSTTEIGKPTGHDIMEGKVTLPLLYALKHSDPLESDSMRTILNRNEELSPNQVSCLVEFAKKNGGIEYSYMKMKELADEAKSLLLTFRECEPRTSLINLIDFFIDRTK